MRWSDYDEAATIASDDDILFRDVSDTTLGSTGTQKRIKKSKLLVAANIEDFDTEISNNTTVVANSNNIATNTADIAANASNISTNANNIALKANIDSPALTGTPTAPTPSAGDNSTKIATTAFVVSNASVPLGALEGIAMKVSTVGNDITIYTGYIEVGGKWYHWNSTLTLTAGPSGSNSGSDALPSSDAFVYVYVDASSLPSDNTTELTAANFISKSTAPSWDDAKHGYYDGDDRFIGAFQYDASSSGFFKTDMTEDGWCRYYNLDDHLEFQNAASGGVTVTFSHVPSYKVCRDFLACLSVYNPNNSYGYLNFAINSTSSEYIAKVNGTGSYGDVNSHHMVPLSLLNGDNTLYLESNNSTNFCKTAAYKIER